MWWVVHFTNKSHFLFPKEKNILPLICWSSELPVALKEAQGIALHFYYLPNAGIYLLPLRYFTFPAKKQAISKTFCWPPNIFNDVFFLDFTYNISPIK